MKKDKNKRNMSGGSSRKVRVIRVWITMSRVALVCCGTVANVRHKRRPAREMKGIMYHTRNPAQKKDPEKRYKR